MTLPADRAMQYTDEAGKIYFGETLAHAGVRVHFGLGDHRAQMLYFSAK